MGKFDPEKNSNFVKVAAKYADRADRLLRKETYAHIRQNARRQCSKGGH